MLACAKHTVQSQFLQQKYPLSIVNTVAQFTQKSLSNQVAFSVTNLNQLRNHVELFRRFVHPYFNNWIYPPKNSWTTVNVTAS